MLSLPWTPQFIDIVMLKAPRSTTKGNGSDSFMSSEAGPFAFQRAHRRGKATFSALTFPQT
jgi:hypothetical protein